MGRMYPKVLNPLPHLFLPILDCACRTPPSPQSSPTNGKIQLSPHLQFSNTSHLALRPCETLPKLRGGVLRHQGKHHTQHGYQRAVKVTSGEQTELFFQFIFFLSHLYSQHGALTHDPTRRRPQAKLF